MTPVTLHHMSRIIEEQLARFAETKVVQWLPDQGTGRARCFLYTGRNRYCVSIHEKDGGGYLGCTVSTRAPRPGEEHTRGSDLRDGRLCVETWEAIKVDIISYELLEIAPKQEPLADVVEG